ncbi:MAG: YkgJ family cysteine cluster protein [Synergistaceae bacterium]
MIEKKQWWSETGLNFTCRMCGKCCGGEPGYIWTEAKERKEIAEHLGIELETLRKLYLKKINGSISIKEKKNFDCIFLHDETRRCTIYPVRPQQCRTFPFWKSMLEDKEEWDFYASRCPGINNGQHYTPKEVNIKFQEALLEEQDKN